MQLEDTEDAENASKHEKQFIQRNYRNKIKQHRVEKNSISLTLLENASAMTGQPKKCRISVIVLETSEEIRSELLLIKLDGWL